MKQRMLYNGLAPYYDLIYSWKDYKKEASTVKKLISKYKKSGGRELLDVGCGTGHHLKYLKNEFSCFGVDYSNQMIQLAKKNVKGAAFRKENMVNFNLNKKFDVILCLFSSIGYVKTYANLKKTIKSLSRHLKFGGIVIIEPWFTKSAFKAGSPHMSTYNGKGIKIARLNISKVKGDISIIDMHYLIAEKNKGVKHYVDRHELGLFDDNRTMAFMKEAGLESKFLKNGLMKDRGLYVGVKE